MITKINQMLLLLALVLVILVACKKLIEPGATNAAVLTITYLGQASIPGGAADYFLDNSTGVIWAYEVTNRGKLLPGGPPIRIGTLQMGQPIGK